ncbi:MAG: Crp/Fnr family transcriptional regulator [Actinomycetota bacterium]|nr:Crp/Fnr family transcriptional regulator [Actinomycetota bacterium]
MSDDTWPEGVDARDNYILGALPDQEYRSVFEALEPIQATITESVFEPEVAIAHVYFPISSVFSLVAPERKDIAAVEVGTIGREGIVGLPVFLGAGTSPFAAFCQIAGPAARIPAPGFRSLLGDAAVLRQQLERFTHAAMVQLAQNVACNRVHGAQQRASKSLLMTHDRVGRDRFSLTQDFLAQMLGVARPRASQTASALQDAGLIAYSRGVITILDRHGLEARACTCYGLMRAQFDGLRTHGA